MTVHVTMLASSLPLGFPHDERTIKYEDEGGDRYTYLLHRSGALTIYKKTDIFPEPEVVYGPSAWESVQGDGATQ
jgi:hypothetical protein